MGVYSTANGGKKFIPSYSTTVIASRIVSIQHHANKNIEVEFEDIDHENMFFETIRNSSPKWVCDMLEDDEQREQVREFSKQLFDLLETYFEERREDELEAA